MNKFIIIGILLFSFQLKAQIRGVIYGSQGKEKEELYGAKARLLRAGIGAVTNEHGEFELTLPKDLPDTLVFSARGFYPDTLVVDKSDRFASLKVILYSELILPDVVVSYKKSTTSISRLKTLHVEEIGAGELRKAACCNLSESFETNASVDVNITDAVSGAKRIQMMGLDGVYTQMQMENIPFLNGLESSYGLTSLPGTWINSIQITKGSGTVVNGYESMAGLINLELHKPTEMEKFYVNFYGNRMGRAELNIHSGYKLSKKWSSAVFAHGSTHPFEWDTNKDGFRDMPIGENVAFFNRYDFHGEKMEAQFGVNAYLDNKIGGQMSAIRRDSAEFYDVRLNSRHLSAFAKTGFFMKKPGHSLGVVYNFKYQEQEAKFGNAHFTGVQNRGYVNLIYDGIMGSTLHKYKVGASMVADDIKQSRDSVRDDRYQLVPGVFAEYTYTGLRLVAVIGARADVHNQYGPLFIPRAHLKYTLSENTDLRFTVGRGWRVPNYMIDNISLMATSRNWIQPDTIMPEVSWNTGASVVQEFKMLTRKSTISVDYYFTYFENQLIVDRDANPSNIYFRNTSGLSFSNSLQAEWSIPALKNLDIRMAYKYLDVRSDYGGKLQQNVFIPKHRGFVNLAYKTRNKKWEYDLTCSIFGKARLPIVELASGEFSTVNESDVWPSVNAQITYVHKKLQIYLGGENIANYVQKNAIIAANEPFSPYFNATRIWAPIYGTNVYIGLRFALEQTTKEK